MILASGSKNDFKRFKIKNIFREITGPMKHYVCNCLLHDNLPCYGVCLIKCNFFILNVIIKICSIIQLIPVKHFNVVNFNSFHSKNINLVLKYFFKKKLVPVKISAPVEAKKVALDHYVESGLGIECSQ